MCNKHNWALLFLFSRTFTLNSVQKHFGLIVDICYCFAKCSIGVIAIRKYPGFDMQKSCELSGKEVPQPQLTVVGSPSVLPMAPKAMYRNDAFRPTLVRIRAVRYDRLTQIVRRTVYLHRIRTVRKLLR